MSKDQEKRKRAVITAQGMIDNAPTRGKGSYLKLPEGLKFFVPEKGKTYKLIFLPWKAGKFNPSGKPGTWVTNRYVPVHKNIGPAEETFICSQRAFGKPCAVCENFAKLRTQGVSWDVLKEMKYRDRELFLIHDLEDARNSHNLMVWDESVHLFGDAFRAKVRKRPQYLAFADFEDGMVVEVDAREKKMGQGSCVDLTQAIEMEKRPEPAPDWMIEAAEKYCLDNCVVEASYAKLAEILGSNKDAENRAAENGEAPADEEPEGEEPEPAEEPADEPAEEPEPDEEPVAEEPDEEPEPEPDPEPEPPPPPKVKPKLAAGTSKPPQTTAKPAAPATKPATKPVGKK